MKILVAGGCGYVGSQLVPSLLEHGYDVKVVDDCWFGIPKSIDESIVTKTNIYRLNESDLRGFDQIIFIGGLSNDPMSEKSPRDNFTLNSGLPSYLAFTAKKAGVKRLIYASTCSVYGYTVGEVYNEEMSVSCGYPYGVSKLQGERGCLQMVDGDFSVIALRKGTIGGYASRMRFDLIVNTMYKNAILNNKITVHNPSLWRPILDMRDAVSAYVRSVQADYSVSGVFNISGGNYTVGAVADYVKDVVEEARNSGILPAVSETRNRVVLDIQNIKDLRNYKVSCQKAVETLGWGARYGIGDTVKDLIAHRDDLIDMNNDRNFNIKVFEKMIASGVSLL